MILNYVDISAADSERGSLSRFSLVRLAAFFCAPSYLLNGKPFEVHNRKNDVNSAQRWCNPSHLESILVKVYQNNQL
jgi:hypothetical protein